jgi:hypothetical protein
MNSQSTPGSTQDVSMCSGRRDLSVSAFADRPNSKEWILEKLQIFNMNTSAGKSNPQWQTVEHLNVKMILLAGEQTELQFLDSESAACLFNLSLQSVPILLTLKGTTAFVKWGPTPPGTRASQM